MELSANDHRTYAVDGEPIAATVDFAVPAHEHDEHDHMTVEPFELGADATMSLALEVVPDPKSGWNAFVTVDGVLLSPEHASSAHVDGEGHMHIYVNGQKLGRLYGTATHIATLPEGTVEITVSANTNDHRPYEIDGAPVEAHSTVEVSS
ncbi:MAG: hypothetical protein R2695_09005 [Acidimicrobiales bacterium]